MKKLNQLLTQLRNLFLVLVLATGQVVAATGPFLNSQTVHAANNGTLKVHEFGTPSGTEPSPGAQNNDPKVCVFNLEGFGFDAAQAGYILIVGQGQSDGDYGPFTFGPTDSDGYYATQPYYNSVGGTAIADGQYKATLYGKDTGGNIDLADEKAKSKVFKVECEEPESASLTVAKEVTNGSNTGQEFPFTVTDQTAFSLRHGEDEEFDNLEAGTYRIAEDLSNLPEWSLNDVDCGGHPFVQNGNSINVTLVAGDDVTCTFINDEERASQIGSITVIKDAQPESTQPFTFTGNLEGPNSPNFVLIDDGTGLANSKTFSNLEEGTYTVAEPNNIGDYELDSINCTGDSDVNVNNRSAVIKLKANENVTCTFVNKAGEQESNNGTLTVHKQTTPDNDPTGFEITANSSSGGTITETPTQTIHDDETVVYHVTFGTYSVNEADVNGWTEDDSACATLVVNANNPNAECTITNTKETTAAALRLNITKTNNRPNTTVTGDTVTYTLIVSVPADSGTSYNTTVVDLPPEGFVYVPGSATATQGSLTEAYGSPGTWSLGTVIPGQSVTLTYQATIASTVSAGTYPDVAFVQGCASPTVGDCEVSVLGNVSTGASTPFVGTLVSVSAPQVLGASTTVLVETGVADMWRDLLAATLLIGLALSTRIRRSLTTGGRL